MRVETTWAFKIINLQLHDVTFAMSVSCIPKFPELLLLNRKAGIKKEYNLNKVLDKS